ARSRGAPDAPVPRIPSTITSAAEHTAAGSPPNRPTRCPCLSAAAGSRSPTATSATSRPPAASPPSATNASPPLSPPPTAATSRPRPNRRLRTSAAGRPAFSTWTRSGTPPASRAARSRRADSSALTSATCSRPKTPRIARTFSPASVRSIDRRFAEPVSPTPPPHTMAHAPPGPWEAKLSWGVAEPATTPSGDVRKVRLLVALADRSAEADLAVVDPDVEPTLRIGADPRLVRDRRPITTIVGEREHHPMITLPTLRELHTCRHHSSPPLSRDNASRRPPQIGRAHV